MKIGIVGLPNVGKSTLFNALTGRSVPAENYPFTTIDPHVGVVAVPDERLSGLADALGPKEVIPAPIEFTDIAGLVKGAAEGEGLGNQFLAHIREVDAILEVVRLFKNPNVSHVHPEIDPPHDIKVVEHELLAKDCETIQTRKESIKKDLRAGAKEAMEEERILLLYEEACESGVLFRDMNLPKDERSALSHLHFLTEKPILYAFNTGGERANVPLPLLKFLEERNAPWVALDARSAYDLAALSTDEREALKGDFDFHDGGVDALIKKGFEALGLLTFFTTAGGKLQAWPLKKGLRASDAAGIVHSDFRDKFIRAEVIGWKDLVNAGSHSTGSGQAYVAARERGLVRTEGKEYVVKDGDVVEFKI